MKFKIAIAALFGCAAFFGNASNVNDAALVTAESIAAGRVGDKMYLSMVLNLDSLDVESNRRIVFTPILIGSNPADTVSFSEVMVNGRRQHIAYQRGSGGFSGIEVRRINNTEQRLTYSDAVPYEEWMEFATLYLANDLCGCGDVLDRGRNELAVIDMRQAPEPEFEALTCFVTPEVEAVKTRSERGSAFIDFVVNRTEIKPDYRGNIAELGKITSTIDLVKNDPNVSITVVKIHGYASPEGSFANNRRLAEGRAEALAGYVGRLYSFPSGMIEVESTPEDWDGLRRYVADSLSLDNRDGILAIIDNTDLAPDARERRLKSRFPQQYRILLNEVYPALRHSDYEVEYVVRPFSLEEARVILTENPRLLSLHELYMIANSYEPGSDEFNEVFEVAVRLFPSDPVANLNAAITAFNRRDIPAAERYLAKAGNHPQAAVVRKAIEESKAVSE